ncbi:MAG: hypothetical protein ACHQ49_14635 [Elusimicrobiota bacterium]
MKAPLLRRAALSALVLLPLVSLASRAETSSDFQALLRSGFKDVSAAAAATPAPSGAPLAAAPVAEGGVFLHSSLDGKIAYCSALGCRVLLNGGVGVVVLAGPGALYFTGPAGTGYCTAHGCANYLPGVRVTFPLTSGPKGDIYGSDLNAGWHCTPDACRQASNFPLQRHMNYISGVYKPEGDFVSSSGDGTFWCSSGRCERISGLEMLFIDANCRGNAPSRAAYAFGSEIYRCTPAGCRTLGRDDHVDNYVECAFDEKGRLLLPARDDQGRHAWGAVLCSENGVERTERTIDSIPVVPAKAESARSSEFDMTGADGSLYRLAAHQADGRPAGGEGTRVNASISRENASGVEILSFDLPVACWKWTDGDQDEDPAMWGNDCRVIR